MAALFGAERAQVGEIGDRLAELGAVDLALAERAVGVDRKAQHMALRGRADVGVFLAGVESDAVGERDLGGEHGQRAVGLDAEEEAVGVAGEGVGSGARGRVGDPDAALGVDVRVVGGDQRDAVDLVGKDIDLAGVDIETLNRPCAARGFESADVGDDDAALGVHVDAVGRAAGVADAVERAVGQRLGGG